MMQSSSQSSTPFVHAVQLGQLRSASASSEKGLPGKALVAVKSGAFARSVPQLEALTAKQLESAVWVETPHAKHLMVLQKYPKHAKLPDIARYCQILPKGALVLRLPPANAVLCSTRLCQENSSIKPKPPTVALTNQIKEL